MLLGLVTTSLTQYVPAVKAGVYVVENSLVPEDSKFVVCEAIAPPCWVSKYHVTEPGPFVSIVPVISRGRTGPTHPATLRALGSTSTVTSVTLALGASTTGIGARLPAVLVTLAATQQFLPELSGSTMYHQPPSADLPTICADDPTLSPLVTIHPTPGPRRQLTATSFGK